MGSSDSEGDEDDVKLSLLPGNEYPIYAHDYEAEGLASQQNFYFTALLSIFWIMLLALFALVTEYDPSIRTPKSQMDTMYIYYHQVRALIISQKQAFRAIHEHGTCFHAIRLYHSDDDPSGREVLDV
jgi:hypothetical protein